MLNLSSKTTFEVSANKAHKILESLKSFLPKKESYYKDESISKFEIDFATIISSINLETFVQGEVRERIYNRVRNIELIEDIASLKESIFEFNIEEGVSRKLS